MATARRTRKTAPEPELIEEEVEELDELDDEAEDLEDEDTEDDDEELEEDEDDLEELEEAEEEDEEPEPQAKKAKKKAPAAPKQPQGSGNDSVWLASYVNEQTGKTYDSRSMRVLLRKLAKEGKLTREIGTDRARYDFPKGANDPVVKEVVKLVKGGALEATRNANLDKARAAKQAKKEKAAAEAAAAAEAPAKTRKTTKTAPAKAAPAKATPATRKRRATAEA